MRLLLAATLLIQVLLILSLTETRVWPALRIWPPPSRGSWQFYFTWVGEYLQLSGVFLLALFGRNSLGFPSWIRFGFGAPLLAIGLLFFFWGFRVLSIDTTLGLGGQLIRSGPYRYSRNPQYVGACMYLAGLAVMSASAYAFVACFGAVARCVLTPFCEEPWLKARFGSLYEAYCRETPRFLGWPGKHTRTATGQG